MFTVANYRQRRPERGVKAWLASRITRRSILRGLKLVFIVSVAVVLVQIIYPRNMALPRASLGGKYAGFKTESALSAKLPPENANLKVKTVHSVWERPMQDFGIKIDKQKTVERITFYSWRQRLIPFSILFVQRHVTKYDHSFDTSVTQSLAADLASQNVTPIDAQIIIEGENIQVKPSADGAVYTPEQITKGLTEAAITSDLSINLPARPISVSIKTEAAEEVAKKLQQTSETIKTVQAPGEIVNVDKKTVLSWVELTPKPEANTIEVTYSRSAIKQSLYDLFTKTYIAETQGGVVLVDSEVAPGANGSTNQALVVEATIDAVIAGLQATQTDVKAITEPITASTQITRKYTKSNKGLNALLQYWAKTHNGQYGITMRTIDGSLAANYNGSKQFTSASVYKLHLAYIVYSKVSTGQLSLDGPSGNGNTVAGCIELMIAVSDNDCAIALGDQVGWQANDDALRAKGLSATTLKRGSFLTTSNDTATILQALQQGSLLSQSHTNSLLSVMKRQIYRDGIPAGSRGSTVADKVGFLDQYNHDAAIVYHPKGNYVLVVLSTDSSFRTIADLATKIADIMQQ